MNNLDRIKSIRAQDYGVAGLSTTDVDWLIAEVERLTVELRASETESLKHALAVGQVCIELSEEKREVERLTADRDRYKAWCEAVMAQPDAGWLCVTPDGSDAQAACREFVRDDYRRFGRVITPMIVRPQPLKESE